MIIDWTITVGNVLQFAVLAVTVAGAVLGVWWRMVLRIQSAKDEAEDKIEALRQLVEKNRAEAAKNLDAFKLDAAKEYATTTMIEQVEERVVAAINRLGDRLDRVLDRPSPARRSTRSD